MKLFLCFIPSPTKDLLDLFGFAHTVRIIAIIQLVSLCISIVGLIFVCVPYAGMAYTEFHKKDYKCVKISESLFSFYSITVGYASVLPVLSSHYCLHSQLLD